MVALSSASRRDARAATLSTARSSRRVASARFRPAHRGSPRALHMSRSQPGSRRRARSPVGRRFSGRPVRLTRAAPRRRRRGSSPAARGRPASGRALKGRRRRSGSSRAQRFLHLRPESLAARIERYTLLNLVQLLDESSLIVCQAIRRPELHADVEVARTAGVHARQAAAADVKDLAALRSRRSFERRARRHRGHDDVRSEDELSVRNENLGVELLAVTLEARIVGDLEDDVNVATRPATLTRVTYPTQRHVLASRDARRNVDRDLALLAQAALAPTLLARGLNRRPLALARRAWRNGHELSEERTLRAPHLAASVA